MIGHSYCVLYYSYSLSIRLLLMEETRHLVLLVLEDTKSLR